MLALSDPSGTWWWFGVRYDGGHGKEDAKKRTGIGTGCMVSIFGSWEKEPGRRRLTRPRREQVREKEKSSPTREDYAQYRHVFCLMCFVVYKVFGKRIL